MNDRGHAATRIATFLALAAFATLHWSGMVDPAPIGRLTLCLTVAGATGVALIGIGELPLGRLGKGALAGGCGLVAIIAGLAAIGVAPRLLLPGGWGDLGAGLDAALTGLAGDVAYPYGGAEGWSRLAILAVAPLVLILAAILAFWPRRNPGRRIPSLAPLVLLVAMYATASAVTSPDGALPRGVLLLALVGAWLWLPTLRLRDGLVATGLIVAAGALAVPAAAQLRGDPWLDYRSWTLRTADGATYSWGHSYGPIDWPRDGDQMLAVRSEEPHYWKTTVLDRFNGVRWTRSESASVGAQHVSDSEPVPVALPGSDRRWVRDFQVAIGDLESDVVVTAGTPIRVAGVEAASIAPDGTTLSLGEPLRNGDTYGVRAYVPDPTADEMRNASPRYPRELVEDTEIELPSAPATGDREALPAAAVATPPWDEYLSPNGALRGAESRRIARSPYAPVLELTRRLTRDQPTVYDSVRAIQDHLRNEYEYSEFPPSRRYPLASFLFEDRRGYCQHFSGAMALMLRMAGVPARVVSGFAPGTRDDEEEMFRVEDFDAHAWVEVYFNDIGWVAFDPTPAAAPVATQQVPGVPTSDLDRSLGSSGGEDQGDDEQAAPGPVRGGPGDAVDYTLLLGVPAGLVVALAAGLALVAARARRHRRLPPQQAAQVQLEELARALERLGWTTGKGATLLGLERRLRRSRRIATARYIERVRAFRYGGADQAPPSLADRRGVRRELTAGSGLRDRIRALLMIPPGGPRRRTGGRSRGGYFGAAPAPELGSGRGRWA